MGLIARVVMKRKKVVVNDLMQTDYSYYLTEPTGLKFHLEFTPALAPRQMLKMGVFESCRPKLRQALLNWAYDSRLL